MRGSDQQGPDRVPGGRHAGRRAPGTGGLSAGAVAAEWTKPWSVPWIRPTSTACATPAPLRSPKTRWKRPRSDRLPGTANREGRLIEPRGCRSRHGRPDRTVLENTRTSAPGPDLVEIRKVLGSFLFSGDDVDKPAGVPSGGEETRRTVRRSSAHCVPTGATASSSRTTRTPSGHCSRSGSSCCPTAWRTGGTTRTPLSWRRPDERRPPRTSGACRQGTLRMRWTRTAPSRVRAAVKAKSAG